jgi:mediator of RNA polymerase II transcription subunit 31
MSNDEAKPQPAAAEDDAKQEEADSSQEELPKNRFELELEFLQALASPAYLHFLATSRSEVSDGGVILQDPAFVDFLKYLRDTWTRPEYSRFLSYPHALYFLDLLIEQPAVLKEWSLPAYRNFCHQQQFHAWQHRHAVCYGRGTVTAAAVEKPAEKTETTPSTANASF